MANVELSYGNLSAGDKLKADDGGNIAANHAYTMTMVLNWNNATTGDTKIGGWEDNVRPNTDIAVAGWSDETWYKSGINMFIGGNGALYAGIMVDSDGGRKLMGNTSDGNGGTYGTISTSEGLTVSDGNLKLTSDYAIDTNVGKKVVLTLTYNGSDTFTLSALKQVEVADAPGTYTYTLDTMTATFDPEWSFTHWLTGTAQEIDTIAISNVEDGVVEHVLAFNRALTVDEITAVSIYVIPEPATATLSLLALAGLAARRRRK